MTRAQYVASAVALVGAVDLARSLVPSPAPIATPELLAARAEPTDITLAQVRVTDSDGARACALRDGRHKCGAKGWQYVGEKTLEISGKRERCVWAHPIGGATISVTYSAVSSTKEAPTTLAFGINDRVSRKGGPVDLEVAFAGETVAHTHPARRGWTRVALPEGSGPLRLSISAEKVGQRHLCYRFE